jgi:TrmH family RNA methyltransferase
MRLTPPDTLSFLRSLADRGARDRAGLMLVEGERFVITALTTRAEVHTVVLAERRRPNPTLTKLLDRYVHAGGAVVHLDDAAFRTLTRSQEPHGVAAVVRQPWATLPERPQRHVWLAFEALRSTGNLGTAIRSAAAAGAHGIILVGDTIDPFDPQVLRATMGAIFHQRIVRADPDQLLRWKRATGCTVIGASAGEGRDFRRVTYRRPLVLMMGSERHGLSPAQARLVDQAVRIPMTGRVDSLNVAVAASLLVYAAALGPG